MHPHDISNGPKPWSDAAEKLPMRASKSYKEKVHDKVPWKQQVIATPVMDVAFQTNRQHGRFGLTRRKEQDQLF